MRRYAFDVDPHSLTFLNRRIFAYADTGVPDGIQIDKNGNVYAGCGDGVQVSVLSFCLNYRSFLFIFWPAFLLSCVFFFFELFLFYFFH